MQRERRSPDPSSSPAAIARRSQGRMMAAAGLESAWEYLITHFSEFQLASIGTFLLHESVFFLSGLPSLLFERLGLFSKYKIQVPTHSAPLACPSIHLVIGRRSIRSPPCTRSTHHHPWPWALPPLPYTSACTNPLFTTTCLTVAHVISLKHIIQRHISYIIGINYIFSS